MALNQIEELYEREIRSRPESDRRKLIRLIDRDLTNEHKSKPISEISVLLEQVAAGTNQPLDQIFRQWSRSVGRPGRSPISDDELTKARDRLFQHSGAVSLGHPTGSNNESIDADLVREYAGGL